MFGRADNTIEMGEMNLKNEGIQTVKQGTGLLEGLQYTFAFTAMSNENWLQTIVGGVGQFLFFPSFAAMSIFKAGLSLYDLIQSKNKNLGKVGGFVRDAVGATIVTTAVVFSFFTSIGLAAITPILFVGALALNAVYNIGAAGYAGYKWATAETTESAQIHKQRFVKHAIGATIATTMTVGVGLMLVAKVAAAAMSIMNAVMSGVGFIIGAATAIKQRIEKSKMENNLNVNENKEQANCTDNQTSTKNNDFSIQANNSIEKRNLDSNQEKLDSVPLIQKSASRPYSLTHYFFKENREGKLTSVKNQNKEYLMDEIQTKEGGYLAMDEDKRPEKIKNKLKLLEKLKSILQDDSVENVNNQKKEIQELLNIKTNNPLQSFMRHTSDMEDLLVAVQRYVNQQTGLSLSSKKIR